MSLFFESVGEPPYVERAYQLTYPLSCDVYKANGEFVHLTYGVGEILKVMEPRTVKCIRGPEKKRIELSNGDVILKWSYVLK